MYLIDFVRATNFNERLSPTLCEQYISFWIIYRPWIQFCLKKKTVICVTIYNDVVGKLFSPTLVLNLWHY